MWLLVSEFFTPAPIRSVLYTEGFLYTGGEDACLRKFKVRDDGEVEATNVVVQHDHWVTALTYQPAGAGALLPEGCVVTGCRDGGIRLYSSNGDLLKSLRGHRGGVTSFSWLDENRLVSGSWDGSAIVWDVAAGVPVQTLGGHENAVSVLGWEQGKTVVTASTGEKLNDALANFKMRTWDAATGTCTAEYTDHEGSIRGLSALASGTHFISCANDGSVKVRVKSGTDVVSTVVHDPQDDGSLPMILTCCGLYSEGGMAYVSGGEDGSCCVWDETQRVASLAHPSTVWCTSALANGDFATGCEDGVLRIFSCDVARQAATGAEEKTTRLNEAAEAVKAALRARQAPTAAQVNSYPKWEEAAAHPGSRAGVVKVFNKGGIAIAAQWDDMSKCWIETGEVTGLGGGGKDLVNGVEYDYALPVELETTGGQVVTFQLGYNTGENPFVAAQRFIDTNEHVSQYHLQQIADFISRNTGAAASAPTFDMTAGGAPSTSNLVGATPGAPAGSSTQMSAPTASKYTFFPHKFLITFDDVPAALLTKVLPKYCEFNPGLSVAEQDKVTALTNTLANTKFYHSTAVSTAEVQALARCAPDLSPDAIFPTFDLVRVVLLHPEGAVALHKSGALTTIMDKVLSVLSLGGSCPNPAALTGLRMLCNVLKSPDLGVVYFSEDRIVKVLTAAAAQATSANKQVRGALSGLLANVAYARGTALGAAAASQVSDTAYRLVVEEKDSADVVVRGFLALGTLGVAGRLSGVVRGATEASTAVVQAWTERVGAGDNIKLMFEAVSILGSG